MLSCCCTVGSLWQPNIILAQITAASGRSELAVSFSPDRLCEEYIVIVSCSTAQHVNRTYKVRSHHVGHSNFPVSEECLCSRLSQTEVDCIFLCQWSLWSVI